MGFKRRFLVMSGEEIFMGRMTTAGDAIASLPALTTANIYDPLNGESRL